MPLFGLGEERLDPDLPFAHGFLVDRGQVVGAHLLDGIGVEGPVHDLAMVAGRERDPDLLVAVVGLSGAEPGLLLG